MKNKRAMKRKRRDKIPTDATTKINEENEGGLITRDLTEVMANVIYEMKVEDETGASDATMTTTAERTRENAEEHAGGLQRGSLRERAGSNNTASTGEAIMSTPVLSEVERRARSAKAPMISSQQLREESREPRARWEEA
jgi:hypothetical protein